MAIKIFIFLKEEIQTRKAQMVKKKKKSNYMKGKMIFVCVNS